MGLEWQYWSNHRRDHSRVFSRSVFFDLKEKKKCCAARKLLYIPHLSSQQPCVRAGVCVCVLTLCVIVVVVEFWEGFSYCFYNRLSSTSDSTFLSIDE